MSYKYTVYFLGVSQRTKSLTLTLESLYAMVACAGNNNDTHLADFLKEHFLDLEAIKKLGGLITNAKRCGDGLGIFQFDQLTMANLS